MGFQDPGKLDKRVCLDCGGCVLRVKHELNPVSSRRNHAFMYPATLVRKKVCTPLAITLVILDAIGNTHFS